jgi:hypothetical protein
MFEDAAEESIIFKSTLSITFLGFDLRILYK